MKNLNTYIFELLANGRYFFTKEDILSKLSLTAQQFKYQAYRLSQKKFIKRLIHDFYMIIPAEHKNLGGLPPHWIIDSLMRYLGEDYYIALLSSASIYGATEQQPMVYQVITNAQRRNIKLARSIIEFHSFKECEFAATDKISSPAGYAQISTKEQTMLDLIRFYNVCGYLSNCANVIKELAKQCDEASFIKVVQNEKNNAVLQRLGFILEITDNKNLSTLLRQELSNRIIQQVYLRPDFQVKTGEYNEDFKIIINDEIELEE
jgi:predicted transcriptional regulator of viral defense system